MNNQELEWLGYGLIRRIALSTWGFTKRAFRIHLSVSSLCG